MLYDTNVTIIVPTQNAKPYADRQIAGLQYQSLRPEKSVIIDSGSTDGSGDIYRAADYQVMSIAAHDFDHGATRNLGFRQTNTEIVLYLTHDAIPHNEHAIARLCAPFADPKVGIVYGRQLARRQAGAIERHARLFNYPTTSQWRQWPRDRALGFRSLFCSNAFAAYRRQTLEEIGGFPEQVIFGEDQVAAGRALLAGWTVVYAGDAEVEHSHGYSPIAEFHRYFDIGVCARINRVLFKRFGIVNGDGRRFVVSEIRYLLRHAPLVLPEAGMRTSFKVLGYLLGRYEMMLPVFIKRRLAMNAEFYTARQTYTAADIYAV